MFETDHGIIVACDVKTLEELKNLVEATAPVNGIVGYKIGFILGLNYGLRNVVEAIKENAHTGLIGDKKIFIFPIPQDHHLL